MSRTSCHISISLDGFIAGPDQSLSDPIGRRGTALHVWHRDLTGADEADVASTEELLRPMGAYVMGRNMFGPVRGEWSGDWRGWWGDDPPYHAPVFVLTNYHRDPIEMAGGTTFHFVTAGFDAAYAQAREVAGDDDVRIAGGASTLRQAFAAGVIQDLHLDIIPEVLGTGERIFDGELDAALTQVEVTPSGRAIHVHYRLD